MRALAQTDARHRGPWPGRSAPRRSGCGRRSGSSSRARLHAESDILQHGEAGRIEVIWKVRQARRARALWRRCVMSRAAKTMLPLSGRSMPEIWWTSVVLPAPFGTDERVQTRRRATSRLTPSVTFRAPKDLLRRRSRRLEHRAQPSRLPRACPSGRRARRAMPPGTARRARSAARRSPSNAR